ALILNEPSCYHFRAFDPRGFRDLLRDRGRGNNREFVSHIGASPRRRCCSSRELWWADYMGYRGAGRPLPNTFAPPLPSSAPLTFGRMTAADLRQARLNLLVRM